MTGNGTAFAAFIADSVLFLRGIQLMDYYREPLPSPTDGRLAAMVSRLMLATVAQREQFQQALTPAQRSLFGILGHRAAMLARQPTMDEPVARGWLLQGLVATAVANYTIPPKRNVEVTLALFHHCARKLGVNTVDLFETAAAYAGTAVADRLRAFGLRSDVRLSSYGWRELKTPEGIRYKFEWK